MGGYNAEKQMLRELAWFLLPQISCFFCRLSLAGGAAARQFFDGLFTFGHRRHSMVLVKITVHHLDEDRNNNKPGNLVLAHSKCHREYHNKKRMEAKNAVQEGRVEQV